MPASFIPHISASDLRKRAERWAAVLGVKVTVVGSSSEIADGGIRRRLEAGYRTHGWHSPSSGYFIYLPDINSAEELDSAVMHEIVGLEGPHVLLGRHGWDRLRDTVWQRLFNEQRDRYIARAGGDASDPASCRAAAEEFIRDAADKVASKSEDRQASLREWHFVMGCMYASNPPLASMLSMDRREFSRLLAASVRKENRERRKNIPEMSREELAAMRADDFDRLEDHRTEITNADLMRVLRFGYPGKVYMSSDFKARYLPMELRFGALFGRDWDKQIRHPYSFRDIRGLVDALDNPLAIFNSKNVDKPDTLLLLLPLTMKRDGETMYFLAPVTPIKKPDGSSVNNIDSIYPYPEMTIMHRLSEGKRTVRYLRPDFEKTFLEPATERIFASLAERMTEKTIPGQTATQLSPRLTRNLTPPESPESRAVEERQAMVLDEIDVATKVVKNFKNPSVPDENVRFFRYDPVKNGVSLTLRESNPLSIDNFISDEEKVEKVGAEFKTSLLTAMTNYVRSEMRPLHLPRMVSGNILTEAGGLNAMLGMMANPKWKTPFFVSPQQLSSMGLRASGTPMSIIYYNPSRGCHVRNVCYNLADTDYPQKYQTTYSRMCEMYSRPDDRTGRDLQVEAIVNESMMADRSGSPLDRTLVRMAIEISCGKDARLMKTWDENLAQAVLNGSPMEFYRAFECAGRRWTSTARSRRLIPEKTESLDDAINLCSARQITRSRSNGVKI